MTTTKFLPLTLVSRKDSPKVKSSLNALMDLLNQKNIPFQIEAKSAQLFDIDQTNTVDLETVQSGLFISVGGDGSMLRLAEHAGNNDIPILGVNCGNVGFLTDITIDNMHQIIDILNGSYGFESRSMLSATWKHADETPRQTAALNEITLSSRRPARLIRYRVAINDRVIAHHHADGLIVATPTGSTAYALSAGGPLLTPSLACLLVLPVCSHKLSSRPIIIPDHDKVSVMLEDHEQDCMLSFDGHTSNLLPPGSTVTIFQHPKKVRLLHPVNYDYFETLKKKLHWETNHYDTEY